MHFVAWHQRACEGLSAHADEQTSGTEIIPPHPNVSSVAVLPTHNLNQWKAVGVLPSDQVTGLFYPRLVESLRRCPTMKVLHLPGEWDPVLEGWQVSPGPGTLNIRSFTDGENELFHGRVALAYPFTNMWDRHEAAYTVLERRFWERFREKHKAWGRNNTVGSLAGGRTLNGIRRVIDVVSYYDRPVPMALLRQAYTLSGLEWDWTTGKRGMEFSEQAWALLRLWAGELDDMIARDLTSG